MEIDRLIDVVGMLYDESEIGNISIFLNKLKIVYFNYCGDTLHEHILFKLWSHSTIVNFELSNM